MFINALAVLMSLYFLFTLDSWHSYTVYDDKGIAYTIRMTSGGLLVILIIKTAVNILIVKSMKSTYEVVTPVLKEIKLQEISIAM
jgi:hypothetical protein